MWQTEEGNFKFRIFSFTLTFIKKSRSTLKVVVGILGVVLIYCVSEIDGLYRESRIRHNFIGLHKDFISIGLQYNCSR
jgi:hypothetical protein